MSNATFPSHAGGPPINPGFEVPVVVVAGLVSFLVKIRECGLSSLVLMIHDIFVTFEDEVRFFWHPGWSVHKVLYFLMRYNGVVSQIFNVYVFFNPSSTQVCTFWMGWQSFTSMFLHWVTQATLCQIVRALYFNGRLMLGVWLAFLVEIGVQIYLTLTSLPKLTVYPFYPDKSFKMCSFQPTSSQNEKLWQYWVPAILLETILFILCACKLAITLKDYMLNPRDFLKTHRRNVSLMETILRDTMWYFLCAFAFDFAALFIFRYSPQTMAYTNGFLGAGFSIVGTRIVLRLHEADDRRVRGTLGATQTAEDIIAAAADALTESGQNRFRREWTDRRQQRDMRRWYDESVDRISQPMAFRTVTTVETMTADLHAEVDDGPGGLSPIDERLENMFEEIPGGKSTRLLEESIAEPVNNEGVGGEPLSPVQTQGIPLSTAQDRSA
ncbi:hypothetical protein SISSUDRAFT_1127015 [Sistotremastrum suecicum HHB10207 ss-3]|uniref:DUF6533 domain-containing protein n=1 Tax=Sistotremastrum suecicum HHB10207 ss-3 TaxID=1314776 RepID=A0A166FIH1_9AGAM|nr:hypothetical protein SISSUDRAFT_1127015 [Sistotremastrum suecicum HHB10207 ss-3]